MNRWARRRIAEWMRMLADRLHPETAPRYVGASFTFEPGTRNGVLLRWDGRGCPLWYFGETDYDRAHDEADTEHTVVLWANIEKGVEPRTRLAGGRS